MGLPIVFIHKDDARFLNLALKRAKASNPDSRLIVIGDNLSPKFDFVEYYSMKGLSKGAKKFNEKYVHLSTVGFDFELFCFQRWFVLNEFMHKEKISACLHLDHDVLLYSNVTLDQKEFSKASFAYSFGTSGHCFFINDLKQFDKLCEFITSLYTNKKRLDGLRKMYEDRLQKHLLGGVCDMTALKIFAHENPKLVMDVSKIRDSGIFDHNINASDGFETFCGLKKIIDKNGKPYSIVKDTKKIIPLKAIHLQGLAKSLMAQFSNCNFSKASIFFDYSLKEMKKIAKRTLRKGS
jgi:hypothetical protein